MIVVRLDELDEHAARRLRMKERDLVTARALPRRLVDQRHAERLQRREGLLDPLHLDRDVVEAGAGDAIFAAPTSDYTRELLQAAFGTAAP